MIFDGNSLRKSHFDDRMVTVAGTHPEATTREDLGIRGHLGRKKTQLDRGKRLVYIG
jgi:hypothetical protein